MDICELIKIHSETKHRADLKLEALGALSKLTDSERFEIMRSLFPRDDEYSDKRGYGRKASKVRIIKMVREASIMGDSVHRERMSLADAKRLVEREIEGL